MGGGRREVFKREKTDGLDKSPLQENERLLKVSLVKFLLVTSDFTIKPHCIRHSSSLYERTKIIKVRKSEHYKYSFVW